MAIDEADQADATSFSESDTSGASGDVLGPISGMEVRVGDYTWADFMQEFGYQDDLSTLYPELVRERSDAHRPETVRGPPSGEEWDRVEFDPVQYLGFHPDDLGRIINEDLVPEAKRIWKALIKFIDPYNVPAIKDVYTWEHYKREFYYGSDGSPPTNLRGNVQPFDAEEALGFDPATIGDVIHEFGTVGMIAEEIVDNRTVNVNEDLDEDAFFSTIDGHTTVVNRYDLEKAVPFEKKLHFRESERYWVNKPYAFVVIFHSEKENEKKYYLIEPYCNEIEQELQEFLSGKLRTAIKYSDEGVRNQEEEEGRREVIERETRRLLKRYDLFDKTSGETKKGLVETFMELLEDDDENEDDEEVPEQGLQRRQHGRLRGIEARPEPNVVAEDPDTLNEYQVEKLLYLLKRDFIGYERIDGIKHDINVEDVSCDGYNSPVFVYHTEYEQIISNIEHGKEDLDDFVVKLAQRSGKGISKRLPQVDATLPDGSRAQLTLGKEVSDHGTNYTIRQFKDVPFTPIDLINWNTFSLEQMAYLWLCIENHKSLIFAGGTASGKTTSLNAVSLFIPSNTKIVSIEDTREVELPQRNWVASMTRPSFSDDTTGDIDEFDLLEAALRQRPDYIVMGEIRGEEGRTLFQVMSTGHTTYTTFHADSVDEVLKRFTTDPINVSKTMFTALDLVSIQTQTRVKGRKVRRNNTLTEINHYEAENDEINVQDVYQWQAETDEFLKMGDSNTLDEIVFDRGWTHEKLHLELFKREVILAFLIKNGLNTYAEVAATIQAFINDPDTIMTLVANGQLAESLEDLRKMESVEIDVDPEKEELVPRPDPPSEVYNLSMDILERAEEDLFDEFRGKVPSGLASALADVQPADPIEVEDPTESAFEPTDEQESVTEGAWTTDDTAEFTYDEVATEGSAESPTWLDGEAQATADGPATTDQPQLADAEPAGQPKLEAGSESQSAIPGGEFDLPELEEGGSVEEFLASTETQDDESAVYDDQDVEVEEIDDLFTDMNDALEALETNQLLPEEQESTEETASEEIDTSDFDEMFPERSLESIFSDSEGRDGSPGDEPDWGLGRRPRRGSRGESSFERHDGQSESADDADESPFGGDRPSFGDDADESPFGGDRPSFGDDADESPFGGDRPSFGDDADESPFGGDRPSFGDDADDSPFGDDADDSPFGDDGDDSLFGDDGDDPPFGDDGDDSLYGEDGDGSLYGEDADDSLVDEKESEKTDTPGDDDENDSETSSGSIFDEFGEDGS